jgi:hypothetical protein
MAAVAGTTRVSPRLGQITQMIVTPIPRTRVSQTPLCRRSMLAVLSILLTMPLMLRERWLCNETRSSQQQQQQLPLCTLIVLLLLLQIVASQYYHTIDGSGGSNTKQ